MKSKDIFREFIESVYGSLPEMDWLLLRNISEPIQARKGEELLSIGERCQYLWFLVKGAVRAYELTEGTEKSNYFFTDRSLFIDYYSIATGKGSELCFVAEEDCDLLAINYQQLLQAYNESQLLERIGRIMAERQFVLEFELRRLFLTKNSFDRYQYLIKNRPEIFQRFSLKQIATFIGITPVSLSRLRKLR